MSEVWKPLFYIIGGETGEVIVQMKMFKKKKKKTREKSLIDSLNH